MALTLLYFFSFASTVAHDPVPVQQLPTYIIQVHMIVMPQARHAQKIKQLLSRI